MKRKRVQNITKIPGDICDNMPCVELTMFVIISVDVFILSHHFEQFVKADNHGQNQKARKHF